MKYSDEDDFVLTAMLSKPSGKRSSRGVLWLLLILAFVFYCLFR